METDSKANQKLFYKALKILRNSKEQNIKQLKDKDENKLLTTNVQEILQEENRLDFTRNEERDNIRVEEVEETIKGLKKVKSGEKHSEFLRKLQVVYGDKCMSKTHVFEWAKRFKKGRESVEDDPRAGAPVTSRTNANVTYETPP
ncbi:hypothetical protein ILUMI_00545 [Ignelater luminosus]|uniref:Mos1 transposase HTH domain-containing protein n=1 Tax=Ignelater luminosus TaxID=2038154 RepID=A0A8K0DH15_IGNLU|nr:hypothetical protein ILUMI_00545 [Ignelater luminosus]